MNIYEKLGLDEPDSHEQDSTPLQIDEVQEGSSTPEISINESERTETAFQIDQVQESAKNSLDFLAALAMPDTFKYLFPPVYKAIWEWLLTYVHKPRDFSQLALGLPRGFAKTALAKLFLLYCFHFQKIHLSSRRKYN